MNNMCRGGIMDLLYKKKLAGTSNKEAHTKVHGYSEGGYSEGWLTEEVSADRVRWREMIRCRDP